MRSRLAVGALVLATMLAAAPAHASDLRFRGQAIVPTGTMFEGIDSHSQVTLEQRLSR